MTLPYFSSGKSNKNQHNCTEMYNAIKMEFSNRKMFCQNKKKCLSIFDIDCLGKKITLIIDSIQFVELTTAILLVQRQYLNPVFTNREDSRGSSSCVIGLPQDQLETLAKRKGERKTLHFALLPPGNWKTIKFLILATSLLCFTDTCILIFHEFVLSFLAYQSLGKFPCIFLSSLC